MIYHVSEWYKANYFLLAYIEVKGPALNNGYCLLEFSQRELFELWQLFTDFVVVIYFYIIAQKFMLFQKWATLQVSKVLLLKKEREFVKIFGETIKKVWIQLLLPWFLPLKKYVCTKERIVTISLPHSLLEHFLPDFSLTNQINC
jgi:hypothetical protein